MMESEGTRDRELMADPFFGNMLSGRDQRHQTRDRTITRSIVDPFPCSELCTLRTKAVSSQKKGYATDCRRDSISAAR